jgi:hypothetical protein
VSAASPLVWAGTVAAILGVLLLRRAWGLARRPAALNGTGWALLLTGTALGLTGNGAWGVAIVSLFAMSAAALLLAQAAATSRPGRTRASDRKAHMLPAKGEPRHIGRRLLTFLVTVPLAMLVSLLVALAARALAGLGGWAEADGNGLTLLLLPLLWGILAFALLMMPQRRTQCAWLLIPAAASLGLIWIGGAA